MKRWGTTTKIQGWIGLLIALFMTIGTMPAALAANAQPQANGSVERLWGTSRYETAAAISAATFNPGVPVAYVATGLNFPDALAGTAATGGDAPILLVGPSFIPTATAAELSRLDPSSIVILGGSAVISDGVKLALGSYTSGTVTRLAGPDRYATAAAISAATFSPGVPVAYIATGLNYPDALAGGPVAAAAGGPILLVRQDLIPSATANELVRLNPSSIVILGGTAAVSTGVETALAGYTTGSVTRLAGPDRYATAAAISEATFSPGVPVAYIATGLNYPDALAGGPAAAHDGGPVLLVSTDSIPTATSAELIRLATRRIVVLGGTGAVSSSVEAALEPYLAPLANDDSASTHGQTTIDVVANDEDSNLDPTTTTKLSDPSHGSLINNGDGTFDYTPASGYAGGDSFTYQVCDTLGICDSAAVTITVTNAAPVAVDDSAFTPQDTQLVVSAPGVLGNDTDADGDSLSVSAFDATSVQGGSVSVAADGSYTYDPPAGYAGSDSFDYTVTDGVDSDIATVTISVLSTSAFTSDDFNGSIGGFWTEMNPSGDASFSISRAGNQLVIDVPSGTRHDAWIDAGQGITFNAPRLMQPAADTDFEIVTKFQSQMVIPEQAQGIIVQQDADTFLRFDTFATGRDTVAFAAFIDGGPDASPYSSVEALDHQPIWLRVTRIGDTWTYSTSTDGTTWKQQLTFSLPLTVTQVGVFAANPAPGGNPAPHNRVVVDYFFNGAAPITPEDGGVTTFDVWYGDNQTFGNLGIAQKFIDILGNVDDPDGIVSLTYRLNADTTDRTLSLGPDTRRLLMPGDFDVQISTSDPFLQDGANLVSITAEDGQGNSTSKIVNFTWTATNTWPLPYSIDWATVGDVQDVAQVVDGQWEVTSAGLLSVDVGYDRLIDIGDVAWDSYEVTVPITIQGLDTVNGYDPPSYGPALGILMGWDGHEDCTPICSDPNTQPIWGWAPSGALGELRWTDTFEGVRLVGLNSYTGDSSSEIAQTIDIGATYNFKMRVEMNATGPLYSLKIWKQGTTEPGTWQLTDQQGDAGDPLSGSFLILVHHVDVLIGNVNVVAIP